MAANLAIPLVGLLLGVAFAILVAVLVSMTALTGQTLDPGHFSVAMVPVYFSWLGVLWALTAVPGMLLALPFIVWGEIKGIRKRAYYLLVGALSAVLGYIVAAAVMDQLDVVLRGIALIPPVLYGLIVGAIYWRYVGRNAGGQTVASA